MEVFVGAFANFANIVNIDALAAHGQADLINAKACGSVQLNSRLFASVVCEDAVGGLEASGLHDFRGKSVPFLEGREAVLAADVVSSNGYGKLIHVYVLLVYSGRGLHPLPAQLLITCGIVNDHSIDFTDSPYYYICPVGGLIKVYNLDIVTISCDMAALVSVFKVDFHFVSSSALCVGRLEAPLTIEVFLKSHNTGIVQAIKKLVIFRPVRLALGVIPEGLYRGLVLAGGADLLTN